MTQDEIKDWLEWFASIDTAATSFTDDDINEWQYAYSENDFYTIGYEDDNGNIVVSRNLEFAIREEIKARGWLVEIAIFPDQTHVSIKRPPFDTLSSYIDAITYQCTSLTELEAIMLAFREAVENA